MEGRHNKRKCCVGQLCFIEHKNAASASLTCFPPGEEAPAEIAQLCFGGWHLSFAPEDGPCGSLASGIFESCRWVFARLVARSVVSLSRAPAIPAKRRTGDSESRRINAAPPIHPCALPQKFIYNFGFSPHPGNPGPSERPLGGGRPVITRRLSGRPLGEGRPAS